MPKMPYAYMSPPKLKTVALLACPHVRATRPIMTSRRLLVNTHRFSVFPCDRVAALGDAEVLQNDRDISARLLQVNEAGEQRASTGRRFVDLNHSSLTDECQPARKKLRASPTRPVEAVFQLLPPLSETPQQALPASSMVPAFPGAQPPHFPADQEDRTPLFVEVPSEGGAPLAMAPMTPDSRIAGFIVARTAAALRVPSDEEIAEHAGTPNALQL